MAFNDTTDNCHICLEPIGDALPLKKCGHRLHATCLEKHFVQECPVCRTPQTDVTVKGTPPVPDIPVELPQETVALGVSLDAYPMTHDYAEEDREFVEDILWRAMNGQASAREIYAAEVALRRAKYGDKTIDRLPGFDEDGDRSDASSNSDDSDEALSSNDDPDETSSDEHNTSSSDIETD